MNKPTIGKYELVDRTGYLAANFYNKHIANQYFALDCGKEIVQIDEIREMYGRIHGINKHSTDRAIIGGKEWKYFRKVDDL